MTRAAQVLGVHPNTIRTWSEQGRLRYFRINARGDRRYRMGDLRRFLSEAERDSEARIERASRREAARRPRQAPPAVAVDAEAEPTRVVEGAAAEESSVAVSARPAAEAAPATAAASAPRMPAAATERTTVSAAHSTAAPIAPGLRKPRPNEPGRSFGQLAELAAATRDGRDLTRTLQAAARVIRLAVRASDVSIWERVGDRLEQRAQDGGLGRQGQPPLPAGTAPAAMATGQAVVGSLAQGRDWPAGAWRDGVEAAVPIAGDRGPWGVLVTRHARPFDPQRDELEWLGAAAALLGVAVHSAELLDEARRERPPGPGPAAAASEGTGTG